MSRHGTPVVIPRNVGLEPSHSRVHRQMQQGSAPLARIFGFAICETLPGDAAGSPCTSNTIRQAPSLSPRRSSRSSNQTTRCEVGDRHLSSKRCLSPSSAGRCLFAVHFGRRTIEAASRRGWRSSGRRCRRGRTGARSCGRREAVSSNRRRRRLCTQVLRRQDRRGLREER